MCEDDTYRTTAWDDVYRFSEGMRHEVVISALCIVILAIARKGQIHGKTKRSFTTDSPVSDLVDPGDSSLTRRVARQRVHDLHCVRSRSELQRSIRNTIGLVPVQPGTVGFEIVAGSV